MRFRRRVTQTTPLADRMTSLIDVVFLLLVFFMLTLKVLEPEGDLAIRNLPLDGLGDAPVDVPQLFNEVQVRLVADADGSLKQLLLGRTDLGGGQPALTGLNHEIRQLIGHPGSKQAGDMTVEIVPDRHLHYEHTVAAIAAWTGRRDEQTGRIIPYVEKVRLASPGNRPGEVD